MRAIKYLYFTAIVCLCIGCNDYNGRIILKTIKIDNTRHIELYRYSEIGGSSPDYVDVKNENGNYRHVFIHPNICSVDLRGDTLFIIANKAGKTLFCEKKNFGLKMVADTSTYFCVQ